METRTQHAATAGTELTQTDTNSATVLAQDDLVDHSAPPEDAAARGATLAEEAGVRPKIGAIPSSYGAPGGSVEPDSSQ
jgi:hypothetical protein